MSDINDDEYQQYLYSEQYAEDVYRARQASFACQVGNFMASLASITLYEMGEGISSKRRGRFEGARNVKRTRLDVERHFMRMDQKLFRRKYRMDKTSFFKLLDILEPHMKSTGEKRARPGSVPNGPITKASRLSMALRYCAGGDPLDISDHHGVKSDEVLTSVWNVVDAIHASPQMNIKFPQTHADQATVAEGFKKKSDIGIDICVGAIDGILIWIHKPSKTDIKAIEFGPAKFFCGRKKKFGLNMQAVCDARGRFLDVYIKYPGSTSDFFAFDQSPLKEMVEKEGFLRPGYCLFGDNAYVNAPYMCVPFRNVPFGSDEDSFNFFQSQLRINIECAFGILVHRFGILRKAIPMGIDVYKSCSLTVALCKLHNFCIDQDDCDIGMVDHQDLAHILKEGGLYRPRIDGDGDGTWEYDMNLESSDRLDALLDGGEHQDDHSRETRRRYRIRSSRANLLPRDRVFQVVRQNGYRRNPDLATYHRAAARSV